VISKQRQEEKDAIPAIVRDLLDKMLAPAPQHIRNNYAMTVERIIRVCQFDLDRYRFESGKGATKAPPAVKKTR
jgi:hypothetical protein